MTVLCIIVFLSVCFILESIYCYLRKKNSKRSSHIHCGEINSSSPMNHQHHIIMKLIIAANDIVFLTSKVVGYIPCHFIRMLFYRYIFHMTIGRHVVIYYGLEVRSPWNIFIGERTIIGDRTVLDARHGIKIGKNVNFSTGVWVWTLQHDVHSPTFGTEGKAGMVEIRDRAWISSRTTILPGTLVETGCVIAAGAVLTVKTTKSYTVYGGVPAKEIAKRNEELDYQFDGRHRMFL